MCVELYIHTLSYMITGRCLRVWKDERLSYPLITKAMRGFFKFETLAVVFFVMLELLCPIYNLG